MASSLGADFDATFEHGYAPLVRALAAICGDAELAADCAQEAFCKAYARWNKISRYEQPLAWVRHVALNAIRDDARRAKRHRRDQYKLVEPSSVLSPEPADFELTQVLAALPRQQRVAAALFYIEQLSVAEVAHAMDLSLGAVKFHLHAARESLRVALDSHRPKRDAG